jgi:hypothetical protein
MNTLTIIKTGQGLIVSKDIDNDIYYLTSLKSSFEINIPRKTVSGHDTTDHYNLPTCYNKTSRSIKKATQSLIEHFNSDTTMYGAMHILTEAGISMRSYCAMD